MAIKISDTTTRSLTDTLNNQNKLLEKVASGRRINRASDDPAGLAIAASLDAAVATLGQASRNVADVGSSIQIADGALEQVGSITSRLAELATQASNGTLSNEQRGALQAEFSALTQEAQRITETTQFNGRNVLDGSETSAQVGTGSDANSQISVRTANIGSSLANIASQDISTQEGARNALESINTFSTAVSSSRGELGGSQARLEFANNSIAVEKENAAAAASRIRDLDIAEAAAKKVANDILSQVNVALGAQSRLSEKQALRLLS